MHDLAGADAHQEASLKLEYYSHYTKREYYLVGYLKSYLRQCSAQMCTL